MARTREASRGLLIRIVYALCLAGATINHVRSVIAHGWLPEHLPVASAIYWSSLTFLDPFAIFLLFAYPRAGIALTVAIIATNVPHNLAYTAAHGEPGRFVEDVTSSFMLMSQIAFLIFVAATAPTAWRTAPRRRTA